MAISRSKRDGKILTTYYQSDDEVMDMGDEGLMGEGATGETAARLMHAFAHDNLNSDTTYSHIVWAEHDEEKDISRFCIADQDHEALVVTVETVEDHYERQRLMRKAKDVTTLLDVDPHVHREHRDEMSNLAIAAGKILDTLETNIELVSSGVNYNYKRKTELEQLYQAFAQLLFDMDVSRWMPRRQLK